MVTGRSYARGAPVSGILTMRKATTIRCNHLEALRDQQDVKVGPIHLYDSQSTYPGRWPALESLPDCCAERKQEETPSQHGHPVYNINIAPELQ
jgi:hypothetical protein